MKSKRRFPSGMTNKVLGLAVLAMAACSLHGQTIAQLRAGFLNPPDEAKPMVRWWWFGPAVVKPEILRELQQMKADGISGAELAFVYPEMLDDPAKDIKNLPFLSPEMLDAVTYAQAEGRKLGLRIDVTLCSGWPYGGPATTLAEAATRLRVVEVAVGPGAVNGNAPRLQEGESLISATLVEGTPSLPPTRRGGASAPAPATWNAATAQPLRGTSFAPSATPRVALYFVLSHTKQQVKRAAVGAEGYVLDPFSHDAVATHLKAVGEPLVNAFGATPPYAIFSDSLEAYGADWTPKLPEEFRRRRGYDLLPHLAELVAGGSAAAEKVRHDYGKTLTELVNENYLVQISDWAKAHGTRFRSQTYGEPAVSFSSQRLVDLIEGEGPQWRAFSTLRWASSAGHVFGHQVTSGETFTWLHSPVFRATPLDMKAEADVDFIMGENSLSFHGWPYSAPAGGEPGWSLYAAAVFNEHNPWHPVMPAVNAYITRLSWLLRQGKPANQVAVLLPTDDAWASFAPGKVTVTGALKDRVSKELMSAILSAGYNVDFIDADAIERVGLGTHQIVVIPPTTRMPGATMAKLAQFRQSGGKVISVGETPTQDAEGRPLAGDRQVLGARVAGVEQLADALHVAAAPDLTFLEPSGREQLGFLHRKLAGADVYFVVNTGNTAVRTTVKFGTSYGTSLRLDPETGAAASAAVTPKGMELTLAPYESRTFLFSGRPQPAPSSKGCSHCDFASLDLSGEWTQRFTGLNQSDAVRLPSDWAANPATLHYSGEVVYSRDFSFKASGKDSAPYLLQVEGGAAVPGDPSVPQENVKRGPDGMPNPLVTGTGPGMHAYYDPPIREAALVFINGRAAGALWHPPYRLDVSKLLKPGMNHIEIRVYNTALNAWSALPPRDYGPLKAKYGDRFQMQDLDRVKPLPSGILGTIKLVQERE